MERGLLPEYGEHVEIVKRIEARLFQRWLSDVQREVSKRTLCSSQSRGLEGGGADPILSPAFFP